MPVPFGPQDATYIEDTGRLLPTDAYYKISSVLAERQPDVEVLRAQLRILFHKINEAEAKLSAVNKANKNYRTLFRMWQKHISKLRKD